MTRRVPPPWTVEESDACFIVKDHAGLSSSPLCILRLPRPASGDEPDDARRGAADHGEHRRRRQPLAMISRHTTCGTTMLADSFILDLGQCSSTFRHCKARWLFHVKIEEVCR